MNSILIRVQIRAVDDKQAGLSVACVFFVKRWRGEYRRQRGLQVEGLGYPPQENVQIWVLRNAVFSTRHEICLRLNQLYDQTSIYV